MKIRKDSLLIRIIFYNDIAIILLAIALAFTFGLLVFDGMELRLYDRARVRINLLQRAYKSEIRVSQYELFNATYKTINSYNYSILEEKKRKFTCERVKK